MAHLGTPAVVMGEYHVRGGVHKKNRRVWTTETITNLRQVSTHTVIETF